MGFGLPLPLLYRREYIRRGIGGNEYLFQFLIAAAIVLTWCGPILSRLD
jgi:hypothetical protein